MALAAKSVIMCAMLAAAPLHAQSSMSVGIQPPAQQDFAPPAYSDAYPPAWLIREALRPRDERTPRQRCIDDETARLGGNVSDLARASIDLKCSQR